MSATTCRFALTCVIMPVGLGTGKVALAFMWRVWVHESLSARLARSWVVGWQSLSPGPKKLHFSLQASVDTVLDIHVHQPPGDILLFLTGQAEIDKARLLRMCFGATDACLCAMTCTNVTAAGMKLSS